LRSLRLGVKLTTQRRKERKEKPVGFDQEILFPFMIFGERGSPFATIKT